MVGTAEVGEMLGISRQRVHQLVAEDPNFPVPEAELAGGRIWSRDAMDWSRDAIEEWPKGTGREIKGT